MKRPRGYILFETVVAIGLLSLGTVVVHNALREAIELRGQAQDFTVARFLLAQKFAEFEMQPILREENGTARYPEPNERFQIEWRITRIELPRPTLPPNIPPERIQFAQGSFKNYMGKIWVRIFWMRAGREQELIGETLFSPDRLWMPPGVVP
jgi:hypothetical protein